MKKLLNKESAIISISSILSYLITLAFLPILTRIYDPIDHGEYGVYTAIVVIICSINSFGLSSAIINQRNSKRSRDVALLSFFCCLLVSFILYLFLTFISIFFEQEVFPLSQKSIILVILTSFSASLISIIINLSIVDKRFKKSSFYIFSNLSLKVTFQYFNSNGSLKLNGLIFGDFLSRIVLMLIGLFEYKEVFFRVISQTSVKRYLILNIKYIKFWFPKTVLDNIGYWLPVPIISYLYGITDAAYFSLVQRLLGVIITIINQSHANLLHNNLAILDDESRKRFFYEKSTKFFWLICLLLLLSFSCNFIFGEFIFAFVFGSKWVESSYYMHYMLPYLFMQIISLYLSKMLQLANQHNLGFIAIIIQIVLLFVSFIIVKYFNFDISIFLILYNISYFLPILFILLVFLKGYYRL